MKVTLTRVVNATCSEDQSFFGMIWVRANMMGPERCCDLCLHRAKPVETLVEARSNSDVQIDCLMWVKGRKTHRTIYLLQGGLEVCKWWWWCILLLLLVVVNAHTDTHLVQTTNMNEWMTVCLFWGNTLKLHSTTYIVHSCCGPLTHSLTHSVERDETMNEWTKMMLLSAANLS